MMARRDGWHDVAEGAVGPAVMAAALLTPFSRGRRGSSGVGARAAGFRYLGDELERAERARDAPLATESQSSQSP